ncbi:MAG: hypothetical protein HUU57_09485 [Bdellovibrio sp.]|nr:hypothetical protein [Bdellovibrio sp.]
MIKQILLFACASLLSTISFAEPVLLTSGTMECYFEIASKKQPGRYEIIKIQPFSVMNAYQDAFQSPLLENRILFSYTPGHVTQSEISHVVINMTYNSANSGVELPIITKQKFVTAIGRQDSDLIGAFLNCTIQN